MRSGLASDLQRLLGEGKVSTDEDDLLRYAGDALGGYRAFRAIGALGARPAVVVWPTCAEDISQALRYATRKQVAVVPYGAGTGVMGAAVAVPDCIVLNLQRMDAVLEVDSENMRCRVQPGAVLEEVHRAMKTRRLLLGHDPWSRPIATVGGAIATDGVGYTAARYGSMGQQVLGMEVVLPDGERAVFRPLPEPRTGPSMHHLFIGSEGVFGVIAEATLKAFPWPEERELAIYDFPNFEAGFRAVAQMYAEGVRPAVVDYGVEMWDSAEADGEATLYLAFDGFREEVAAHKARAHQVCLRFEGKPGDQREVVRYWKARHASGERYRREVLESPDPAKARRRRSSYRMEYIHVSIPTSRVLEYRRRCRQLLEEKRVLVREWSLWARPEFFSYLIVEEDDPGGETSLRMGEVVDRILTLAVEMGGSMEYCHGVGVKLAHLMGVELGAGLEVLRRIKRSLDPAGILNPGKLLG